MNERSAKLDIVVAASVIAQQVAGKVARDAMYLAHYPATSLPPVILTAAVLSLGAVLLTSSLMAKRGPGVVVPAVFVASGLAFTLEWLLAAVAPGPSAVLVYIHTTVAGGLMVSGFWSIVNERFDPHSARRNIVRITTGATLGGLVGGLGSKWVADMFDPRSILLLLAAMNVIGAVGVRSLAASVARGTRGAPSFRPGIEPLATRPYLRNVASLVVVIALLEVLLDCTLKNAAKVHVQDGRALVSFFAIFHTSVSLLTFVVQVTLSSLFLDRLGLGATLAVLPAGVMLAAVGAAGVPSLAAVAIATGLEVAMASSLFRSAYEILFTPLPVTEKRALKVIIDVAVPRLGAILGGGVVALAVALALRLDATLLVGAATLGVVGLALSLRLHRMYVGELATSLQLGIIDLRASDAVDATTRHTLMSTMAIDRGRLLARIEAARSSVMAQSIDDVRTDGDPDVQLVEVLSQGLAGDDFDVLHTNARALAAICVKKPHLAPTRERIFASVTAILSVDASTWRARRALASDGPTRSGPHRALELVFILLGLVLDRAMVKGCLEALARPDTRLRGTALEYLDNVLPAEITALLRPKVRETT